TRRISTSSSPETMPGIDNSRRINIEAVSPELDCGRYAVKREVGDHLEVTADIFKDGHDAIAAAIQYRVEDQKEWSESRMRFVDNDRWSGSIPLSRNLRYDYTIVAWTDWFATWASDLRKKYDAGQDVSSELLEGAQLVRAAAGRARADDRPRVQALLAEIADTSAPESDRVAAALSDELLLLME